MNNLLHVIHYRAMEGNYTVIDTMEPHYGIVATEAALERIRSYYKDDLIEFTVFGPECILESYNKHPYSFLGEK